MASPQIENGYTKIANEILDALCGIRIGGEARQVIDTIIRKTYGFSKKEDYISLSQFCAITRMRRPDVCRAINKAVLMNIVKVISKKATGQTNKYSINKDFETWKPLAKKLRGVAKKQIIISKKANKPVAKKQHTKERLKKVTKERGEGGQSPLVPEVIFLMETVNPSCKSYYNNQTQRRACHNLIETYGFEQVSKVIAFLPMSNKMSYMPAINTPLQLWEKYQSLKDKLAQKKGELVSKGRGLEV